MLDIENEVFSKLTDALKAVDPEVQTSSVYTNTPPAYPFVSIEEVDSRTNPDEETSCAIDAITDVYYEINVYCKDPEKKSKAKTLANTVDEFMLSLGFSRVSKTPIQNDNETIYRLVIRYNGHISKQNKVYRK